MQVSRIRRRSVLIWACFVIVWLSAACAPATPPPAPPTETPFAPHFSPPADPADALAALIEAERAASINGDLALLAQLWAPDAQIVDGRNTPTPDDDYIWAGRAAIMDRYVLAVFPNPPPPLDGPDALADLSVEIEGDAAVNGVNGGDRWRMRFADGRWWLYELRFQ